MIEQILLRSDSFDGVREIGGFGQPLHSLYPQIRAVLSSELEPEAAWLLADPVVDRAKNRIDWYTQGDPDHKPVALSELSDEQRRPILARIDDLLGRGREVAERYAATGDARRVQLGAILRAVLVLPAETEIYLVEGKPTITGWGFAPDRPWEAPGGPTRSSISLAEPAGSGRDVTVPDVVMPELPSTPELAPPTPSPVGDEPPAESLPPPLPEPTAEPARPSTEPVGTASIEPAPLRTEPESPPEPEAVPAAADPTPVSDSSAASPFRYVVVGSRYFWGVVAVALLLVLLAVYWGLGRERSAHPIASETAISKADAKLDDTLAHAQRQEAELRTRLEQLLVQLAGRRGQCPLPVGSTGSDAADIVPTPGSGADVGAVPAAPASRAETSPAVSSQSDGQAKPVAPAAVPDAVVTLSGIPGRDGSGARVGVASSPSTDSEPTVPLPVNQPPVPAIVNPLDTLANPPTTATRGPTDAVPPGRTLEEILIGRESGVAAPSQPPAKPPIKAEPTAEERREFANRMSATGATTGEITATLLWNGPSDLDLVVRCPSGRQLDFRNTAECGGTLDVDANTARGSLSERPMENAYWPAGKAGPGMYEVLVRYVPRKDEERPRETPFQVHLSQSGQESVFKGAIRPNAVVPVTTFDVRR